MFIASSEFERGLAVHQRCAGAGVQELTQAGVGVFQQELEQDQEGIYSDWNRSRSDF